VTFGFLLFALGDALANTVWVLVVFFAFAYSMPYLRFKERPFLDSFTSALHFVGPLVYGIVLADGQPLSMQVWPVLLAFVLWAMASHAFGAVQDVRADRTGGIASIATAMGARRTVRFSIALYVASSAVLLLLGWPRLVVALLPLAYLGVALPYVAITDENCEEANGGWRLFLWLNQAVGAFVTIALIAVATGRL
jgi:4-hydroxybenzoate polyprenyltransferase